MPIPALQKQPGEIRTVTFRFNEKLTAADTLTGTATVTITPSGTLAVVGTPTVESTTPGTGYVNVRLTGGTDAADYNVQCAINTTLGDKLQLDFLMEVRERAN